MKLLCCHCRTTVSSYVAHQVPLAIGKLSSEHRAQCCGDSSLKGALGAYSVPGSSSVCRTPRSSSMSHLAVPSLVAMHCPPMPATLLCTVLGGSGKSLRSLVILVVVQLSTPMTNESESKLMGSLILPCGTMVMQVSAASPG